MKITFPNPDDYVNDIMGFLDQMELCIHHARKSAEKILSNYSKEDLEEGNDTPFVNFGTNSMPEEQSKIDEDMEWRKEVYLEIVEV